jgi:hypothetical protein
VPIITGHMRYSYRGWALYFRVISQFYFSALISSAFQYIYLIIIGIVLQNRSFQINFKYIATKELAWADESVAYAIRRDMLIIHPKLVGTGMF